MPSGSIRVGGGRIDMSARTAQFDARMTAASARIFGLQRRFNDTVRTTNQLNRAMGRGGTALNQFTSSMRSSIIATAAYAAGITALTRVFGGSTRVFLEYNTGLTEVRKTAGLTNEQTRILGENIRRLRVHTSSLGQPLAVPQKELLDIAVAAGQMNIKGVPNILRFTESVALMGLTTDLAGRQAARGLGLIINNTKATVKESDRLVATLTALGNTVRGGESEIIAQATEIARQTAAYNLNPVGVLATAATFSGAGARPETAGTSVQRQLKELIEVARRSPATVKAIESLAAQTYPGGTPDLEAAIKKDLFEAFRISVHAIANAPAVPQTAGGGTREDLFLSLYGGKRSPVRVSAQLSTLARESAKEFEKNLATADTAFAENTAAVREAIAAQEQYALRIELANAKIQDQAHDIGERLTKGAILPALENFKSLELGVAAVASAFGGRFIARWGVSAYDAIKRVSAAETKLARDARRTTAVMRGRNRVYTQARHNLQTLRAIRSDRDFTRVWRADYGYARINRATLGGRDTFTYGVGADRRTVDYQDYRGSVFAQARAAEKKALDARNKSLERSNRIIAKNTALRRAASRATRAFGSAVTFLGGPLGAGITLLTLAASAWAIFGSGIGRAKEGLEGFEEALASAGGDLGGLTDLPIHAREIREEVQNLEKERASLEATLNGTRRFPSPIARSNAIAQATEKLPVINKELEKRLAFLREIELHERKIEETTARVAENMRSNVQHIALVTRAASRLSQAFINSLNAASRQRLATAELEFGNVGLSGAAVGVRNLYANAELSVLQKIQHTQANIVAEQKNETFYLEKKLAAETAYNTLQDNKATANSDEAKAQKHLLDHTRQRLNTTRDQLVTQRKLLEDLKAYRLNYRQLATEALAAELASQKAFFFNLKDSARQRLRTAEQESSLASILPVVDPAKQAAAAARYRVENQLLEKQRELAINTAAAQASLEAAKVSGDEGQINRAREYLETQQITQRSFDANIEDTRAQVLELEEAVAKLMHRTLDLGFGIEVPWQTMATFAANTVNSLEDQLVNLALVGKFSFKDLANSIVADLTRILVRAVIVNNIIRAITAAFPSLGYQAPEASPGYGPGVPAGGAGGPIGPFRHAGGMAEDVTRGMYRRGGLRHDEVPAILQRGEELLPRSDPRHRWNFGQIARRWARFHEGGVVGGGYARPGLNVEIVNQTSTEVTAEAGETRMDAGKLIQQIILSDARKRGPVLRGLEAAMKRV